MQFDDENNYYFASVGINTLLNENQSDNNVSNYGQIIGNNTVQKNTPFILNNVTNLSFNISESTMFGRNKLYTEKRF